MPADNHVWKFFDPRSVRDFGLFVDPFSEQTKLLRCNLAILDALEQMLEQ